MDVKIIDITWERIYLNILVESQNFECERIYLASESNMFKLNFEKKHKGIYETKINITNIINAKMLANCNYHFVIRENNEFVKIPISFELGYKMEYMDKVYRYGKERYAYTVDFNIQKINEEEITCVMRSRFMVQNKKFNYEHKEKLFKKINKKMRKAFFYVAKKAPDILYKMFSLLHLNNNKNILIMSETRTPIGGNLRALDDRLKERNINNYYKISYAFQKTLKENRFKLIFKYLILIWKISKQELIFIDDYSPIFKYINLSKKTKLIQLWHAGVGFKSVGYARFGFGRTFSI